MTRPGEIVLPVDVLVRFENGEVVRESWDGRETWKRFTYVKEAKAASAAIDPEGVYAIDLDRNNNSLTLERDWRVVLTLALHWLSFGVDAVLLSAGCVDPLYRKTIRVSMGGALRAIELGFVQNEIHLASTML